MTYSDVGKEIGEMLEKKQDAYGDSFTTSPEIIKIWLRKYENPDGTYTIPKSLVDEMLTIVRIVDKLSRVMSNPDGDKMGENPYKDIAGYCLLKLEEN